MTQYCFFFSINFQITTFLYLRVYFPIHTCSLGNEDLGSLCAAPVFCSFLRRFLIIFFLGSRFGQIIISTQGEKIKIPSIVPITSNYCTERIRFQNPPYFLKNKLSMYYCILRSVSM